MTITERPSPYQGLDPYAEVDAAYFFGRTQESATIAANLAVARLTIFYGPSGVGKSSVLRAGVIPMLKQRAQENVASGGRPEIIPIYFNRWQQEPLTGLAQAIQEAVQPFAQTIDGQADTSLLVQNFTTLLNIASAQTDSDLLIILDQFEEYFLYPDVSGPDNFANAFVQAINSPDLRANFLLSLREDMLARLDYFKGRITFLLDNRLRIDQLSHTAGREAITKPLAQYNRDNLTSYTIEPELVEAVLDQIGADNLGGFRQDIDGKSADVEQRYIETPYLQLVMTRLWEQVRKDKAMTLRLVTMNALGGAETIVRNYLNSSMNTLSLDMQAIAARWFDRLVTPGGTDRKSVV